MANTIMGLLAETAIHAGASTSEGVIDLPIQREAHTGWPVVYGSGVKGSLRTAAEDKDLGEDRISEIFGPDTNNAGDFAGALAVSDAKLLLFPVRSLTSHFKWVTCPAILKRFAKDCQRMQLGLPEIPIPTVRNNDEAIVHTKIDGTSNDRLFLEELSFQQIPQDLNILTILLSSTIANDDAKSTLENQLVIVSDDNFAHIAKFATPVAAHIAINNETKIVKQGALWYEETLPPETVLYTCLHAQKSRKQDGNSSADDILGYVKDDLFGQHPYFRLGGNETVGMGWCKAKFIGG